MGPSRGEFVRTRANSEYRCVLLPYREAGVLVGTGTTRCRTFREVSYELLRGTPKAAYFLPAIAVFRPGNSRRYLPLFERMRQRRDCVSDGWRFTVLSQTDKGKSVAHVIRQTDRRTAPSAGEQSQTGLTATSRLLSADVVAEFEGRGVRYPYYSVVTGSPEVGYDSGRSAS